MWPKTENVWLFFTWFLKYNIIQWVLTIGQFCLPGDIANTWTFFVCLNLEDTEDTWVGGKDVDKHSVIHTTSLARFIQIKTAQVLRLKRSWQHSTGSKVSRPMIKSAQTSKARFLDRSRRNWEQSKCLPRIAPIADTGKTSSSEWKIGENLGKWEKAQTPPLLWAK